MKKNQELSVTALEKGKLLLSSASISILFLLAGIAILFFCEWRGSLLATFTARNGFLYLSPFFLIVMIFAHADELKKYTLTDYIKKLWGNSDKERIVYLDCVRALAVALIILTHACSMQKDECAEPWKIGLLTVISSVSLVANPIYIMISGALILSSTKKESVGHFYYTRFIKVFVPFFIIYFILMIISGTVYMQDFQSILNGLKQILKGPLGIAPHFWFVYTILGLYLSAPFFKTMVQNMSDKQILSLFFLILAEEIIATYLPLTGISLGVSLDFAKYAGLFLIGYIITCRSNKIMDISLMISGFLCGIFTALIVLIKEPSSDLIYNCSPVAVLFSAAIIIALKRNEERLKKLPHKIITAISINGYLILLLHWYGLFNITFPKLGVQPLRFGCIGGIGLTLILTLIVCYILSLVAENTIIISVKYLLTLPDKITHNCKRRNPKSDAL